jgi:hypothetical protein
MGANPFDARYQFANDNYPIGISYDNKSSDSSVNLPGYTKNSFYCWASADPRVSALSGVPIAQTRIRIILEDKIVYSNITNIIGLTTVEKGNIPAFSVEIARKYLVSSDADPNNPNSYLNLTNEEIAKVILHEIGHALGLGHSPDARDLMYYQINATQGQGYEHYLTFGDAMALWTTLNARGILWVQGRAPFTDASSQQTTQADSAALDTRSGDIVCIYRKQ